MKRISGRIICDALGLPASGVDALVRRGFEPIDRNSNLPGRGRAWTYKDLVRLCLAIRLDDLLVFERGAIQKIPALPDIPGDERGWFVAVIDDEPLNSGASAPAQSSVHFVVDPEDLFNDDYGQVLLIPLRVVLKDVQSILSLRAREDA